jgi:ribosomal protein L40E
MSTENLRGQQRRADHLDADAVCAQCGTVNPEATLICRVCGNNLRDQRLRRLQAEQQLEGKAASFNGRQVARAVFGTLALLLLLWVAINAQNITDAFYNVGGDSQGIAAALWSGPDGAILQELSMVLAASQPSPAAILAARATPTTGDQADGRYVIFFADATEDAPHLGTGIVRTVGDAVYFVAQLSGGGEVRGKATRRGSAYVVEPGNGAVFSEGAYSEVVGFARGQDDGSYEVAGASSGMPAPVTLVAYRLPA